MGLGQEEEGRGLRQTARGSRDGGDEDGEFRFSCGEGATVVSKGCSDMKVREAALVPLRTRITERAREWEGRWGVLQECRSQKKEGAREGDGKLETSRVKARACPKTREDVGACPLKQWRATRQTEGRCTKAPPPAPQRTNFEPRTRRSVCV